MLNIQEVYEQYFTIVYRYLLSLSHNTHIAEELTQETFFKALKKVDDFRGDCDLRVWLCQISRNTYYDYLKKNKKYAKAHLKERRTDSCLRCSTGQLVFSSCRRGFGRRNNERMAGSCE